MVIIGTAFNGPVGRAIPVYSPEHAKYIFGDSFDSKTRKEATSHSLRYTMLGIEDVEQYTL